MNPRLNQYQSVQVATASREQILIMLYDGAIRFLRQAAAGLAAGDQEAKGRGIRNAMAIIMEFRKTLDRKIGGQIAADLDALYEYMTRELTKANLENSADSLKVVENLLVDLRETWAQAIEMVRQENRAQNQPGAEQRAYNAAL